MNFIKQTINFRRVVAGDSFEAPLYIDPRFPLTPETEFIMDVRPYGDIPQPPIVTFKTSDSVTIDDQKLTIVMPGERMQVRPGRYQYDGKFIQGSTITTLFGGLFEIISTSTQSTN